VFDLIVENGVVLTSEGEKKIDIAIEDGRIKTLGLGLSGRRTIDASGLLVLPGAIDAHTHMELPVRGERSSDDFLSGTIAAACGGVTTIADFSVGSPDTALPEEIEARLEAARKSVIDFTLHGEVVGWRPGEEEEFSGAIDLGVRTFKFYTTYSRSGRMTDTATLYHAFQALARYGGRAFVHAENDAIINDLTEQLEISGELGMPSLALSRPVLCEEEAIARVCLIARHVGVPLRIAHVTSEAGLNAARTARKLGGTVTVETCPQYLLLDESVYEGSDAHLYAATPPLRTPSDCDALWQGLEDGAINLVATDHCPFTRAQKRWTGSFIDLPYGLPGVETLLSLLYSEGVAKKRFALKRLVSLLSEGPARALGIYPQKGAIAVGTDADLVLLDPKSEWTIRAEDLHMKTDFNPYEGCRVTGQVVTTLSRGRVVFDRGEFLGEAGWGRFLPQGG
jgi:dihydropyrimidinase